ncbi:MAG: hypothetical protein ACI31I_02195 [Bacilli bacterium]
MKLELNKFKLKQVLLSAFVLLISFGAAATATFAWFTVNRNANIGGNNISISEAVSSYTLKYYKGNYTKEEGTNNLKYTGYQSYSSIEVCDYYTEFKVPDENESWNNLSDIFPDTRYSFSCEIELKASSNISRAGLAITKYTSTNTTSDGLAMYKVDPDTKLPLKDTFGKNVGIYLSEAINVYSTCAIIDSDPSVMNSYALNFLHGKEIDNSSYLIDAFNETGSGGDEFDGVDLATINSSSLAGQKIVVFFTIEFSNSNDTYYSFYQRDVNDFYYYKDTVNGSSNCYQKLSFKLETLSLFAS